MAHPVLLEKECTPNCHSSKHVDRVISQISKLSLQEFQAYSSLCYNWSQQSDLIGRTALHLAASCGKTEILEWLLEEQKMDLSVRDMESGYTALHRAIYYGQLAAAKILIQYDSDLQVLDNEGLSPLDLAVTDRPPFISCHLKESNEISTWGENINSILGHPSTHKRVNPDIVSEFKKLELSIKQVVVCKYHSVFLTSFGLVFTCGHGQGGRLGHGDQYTVLVPKLVQSVKTLVCLEIAAGTDHTLLRMEGGSILSCGLNTWRQLGQSPDIESSLVPRQIKNKALKKKTVCGICAGRFHSVVWTTDEIYAVGLNAGQLGHPRGDKYVDQMQPVPALRSSSLELVAVACSDAATACLTAKGDVFLLHEYQCRRIAVRLSAIKQIVVTGGTLDHHTGVDLLMEKGGHEVILVLRNKWGQLYVWRGSHPTIKRCHWKMKRQLSVSDVAVSEANLIVTTDMGQAYMGKLSNRKSSNNDRINEIPKDIFKDGGDVAKQPRLLDRLLKEEKEEVMLTRLPGIHKALRVASDRKGRNFAVIQAIPRECLTKLPTVSSSVMNENIRRLLLEVDESDIVHDAVIQVEDRTWPVHRFIISSRSHYFYQACHQSRSKTVAVFKVEGVLPESMEQIVQFMYTNTCDFLNLGCTVKENMKIKKDYGKTNKSKTFETVREKIVLDTYGRQRSAFQAHQRWKKEEKNQECDKPDDQSSRNALIMLREASEKMGIKNLSRRLNEVKCTKGVISEQYPVDGFKFQFDKLNFPYLNDVTIATEDGKEIYCHKCILIARLDYFYSMFATGWAESVKRAHLKLPAPGEALEILIDYLYTDVAPQVENSHNEKLLCEVLVVSDQFLAWRLKEMCEVALANIVSFKNVAEFLEFSIVYNANQLKETCKQFVSLNLSAVLEARSLEVLSEETLQELTDYYRSTIPTVAYRVLTPFSHVLDQTYLDDLVTEYQNLELNLCDRKQGSLSDSAKKAKQAKKRARQRVKSVSIEDDNSNKQQNSSVPNPSQSRRSHQLSVSSDVSIKSEEEVMSVMEELNEQIAVEEKKTAIQTAKLKKDSKHCYGKTVNAVPTQPDEVPAWTPKMKTLSWADHSTIQNTNNSSSSDSCSPNITLPEPASKTTPSPTCSASPSSPSLMAVSPTTSLRDIMKQEYQTNKPGRKQSFPSHFSRKEGKKHRMKEDVQESNVPSSPKSPICPWGSVDGVVSSFRDLMLQDKDRVPQEVTPVTAKGPGTSSSAGSSRSSRSRRSTPIAIPVKSPSDQPTSPRADNPWQRRAESAASTSATSLLSCSTSPPPPQTSASAVNFSDILQDEMEKEEILVKTRQKPLALIQLEEKAMQELLQHYHASDRIDDYVTVERVSKNVAAAPIWHRERLPSGPL